MMRELSRLKRILIQRGYRVSVAESCTGGLLSKTLTDISGSSEYFVAGLVTYSNEAKMSLLDVRKKTLDTYGAVSRETASEMLNGLKRRFKTDICVSITGIAGPSGGSRRKPVGTVFIGLSIEGETYIYHRRFKGDRKGIREQTVRFVLSEIIRRIGG